MKPSINVHKAINSTHRIGDLAAGAIYRVADNPVVYIKVDTVSVCINNGNVHHHNDEHQIVLSEDYTWNIVPAMVKIGFNTIDDGIVEFGEIQAGGVFIADGVYFMKTEVFEHYPASGTHYSCLNLENMEFEYFFPENAVNKVQSVSLDVTFPW